VNFARLNHVLIPSSKTGRDRFRNSFAGRVVRRAFSWVLTLTDEGIGALVLWLLAMSFSLNVGTTQFYFLWSALTGLLVAAVLFSRRYRLKNVSLEISSPRRISRGSAATFCVTVHNNDNQDIHALRVHLPFLPWDGAWRFRPDGFASVGAKRSASTRAEATFTARGLHHLDLFHVSALAPFGLSHGPAVQGACAKFWVVPKIAPVQSITLPVAGRYQPGGVSQALSCGEFRELAGIRPYRPGDNVRDLHAASWARTGEPHVREFRQEYFLRIGLALDGDKTGCKEALFEAALSLLAGVAARLCRGEAVVDLMISGDKFYSLSLEKGRDFLDRALELSASAGPGGPQCFETLKKEIAPRLNGMSSLIFITLHRDEKRAAFEEFILSRNTAIRTLHVSDKKTKNAGGDLRCTALTVDEINGDKEIFL
jgi:uncharacterized protein (DUF58 family)